MASDPLAPHIKIVSTLDDAIDQSKLTSAKLAAYLDGFDPKHLEGCFKTGMSPAWFCITPLKQSVLSNEVDPAGVTSRKLMVAFLYCCHRIERPDGTAVMAVDADEWASEKSPRLASDAWWDRCGDEFGDNILHTIAISIINRARLPKSKRGPLP